jgi:hypothetical protein
VNDQRRHRFDIRRIGATGTRGGYHYGNSHHYWWDGQILGRPRELYRAPHACPGTQ